MTLLIGLGIILLKLIGILDISWFGVVLIEIVFLIGAIFELKIIYKLIDKFSK